MVDAFDHNTQTWHTGREGSVVLLRESREELTMLLDAETGEGYATFIGLAPEHVGGYIATMLAQVERLSEELGE